MNETTGPQPSKQLAALQAGNPVRAIVPNDFDSVWRISTAIVKAGMAPKELETVEKCTIAIMHGLEVGLTPMAALQSIALINGRPTIYGDGALGLCQGSGKMEWHKEWYEGTEGKDDYTAHCLVKRLGDPETKLGKFSVADAKTAKLWGKAGPWTQYARRMLQMRARAFALRDGFSDVLKGLGIAEEVRDTPMKDVTPPAPPEIEGIKDEPIPPVVGQSISAAAPSSSTPMAPPDIDLDESAPAILGEAQIPLDGEIIPPQKTRSKDDIFLEYVDKILGAVQKAEDLEICWNDNVKSRFDELSSERRDDAYGIWRKHEVRLGID